jgi:hypothetical protein
MVAAPLPGGEIHFKVTHEQGLAAAKDVGATDFMQVDLQQDLNVTELVRLIDEDLRIEDRIVK